MLDHPKWTLFVIFVFGMLHMIGHVADSGQLLDPNMPQFGWSFLGIKGEFERLLFFRYD